MTYKKIIVENLLKGKQIGDNVKYLHHPSDGKKEMSPASIQTRLNDTSDEKNEDAENSDEAYVKSGHWIGDELNWHGVMKSEEWASYSTKGSELDYFLITNSTYPGIVSLEYKMCNNTLISSGKLTGCMCLILFIRDINTILFYHVGQAAKSGKEYQNTEMISDLVKCVFNDVFRLCSPEQNKGLYIKNIFNNYYKSILEYQDENDIEAIFRALFSLLDKLFKFKKRLIAILYQKQSSQTKSYDSIHIKDTDDFNFLYSKYKNSAAIYVAIANKKVYIYFCALENYEQVYKQVDYRYIILE